MTARHTFIAQFDGWCPACHQKILAGEPVCFDDDRNVVHECCAEDDE
jgi:hypothetical protein